jgi:hypothetical protein
MTPVQKKEDRIVGPEPGNHRDQESADQAGYERADRAEQSLDEVGANVSR